MFAGAALASMLAFFQALVAAQLPGLKYKDLLGLLVAPIAGGTGSGAPILPTLHKQAFHSLAKCVAALTVTWKQEAIAVVEQFLHNVAKPTSDSQHIFALLVIGEIGRHM